MFEGIKRRLLHFTTDGRSIVSDFVAARQKRAGILRRAVHACFYVQCAAALVCIICGFASGGALTGLAMTLGAAAAAAAALMAVAGEPVIRAVSFGLDMVYAAICFIVWSCGMDFMLACGVVMLLAALAALCGLTAGYFRDWLLAYPPVKLTESDYTLTGGMPQQENAAPETTPEPEAVPEPPKPSELFMIAERVSQIMNARGGQSAQDKEQTEVHTGESTQG